MLPRSYPIRTTHTELKEKGRKESTVKPVAYNERIARGSGQISGRYCNHATEGNPDNIREERRRVWELVESDPLSSLARLRDDLR